MKSLVKLKPGHKWFAAESLEPIDGWFGLGDTLEKAVLEAFASGFIDDNIAYIIHGGKSN